MIFTSVWKVLYQQLTNNVIRKMGIQMLEATESMILGIGGKQGTSNTAKHANSETMDIQFLHCFQYFSKI